MMHVLGELLSISSASVEIYERGCRTYRKSLAVGLVRYGLQLLAYVLLGGMNGAAVTFMAIIRQLFLWNKKFMGAVVWIWAGLSVFLNLYFARTLVDLLPLVATLQFTFMVKEQQNARGLKVAQVINTLIWGVYQFMHCTWVYLFFGMVLTMVTLVRLKRGVED